MSLIYKPRLKFNKENRISGNCGNFYFSYYENVGGRIYRREYFTSSCH